MIFYDLNTQEGKLYLVCIGAEGIGGAKTVGNIEAAGGAEAADDTESADGAKAAGGTEAVGESCPKWADSYSQNLTLIRAYGESPSLSIPDVLPDGRLISVIAPYCFAKIQKRYGRELESITSPSFTDNTPHPADSITGDTITALSGLTPIAGKNLESITLPASVTQIGEYAFYNCRRLQSINVGDGLRILHADVFMNCTALHSLTIEGDPEGESGLFNLLSRIDTPLEVCFADGSGHITARLLYPGFSLNYETVGPAHLFQIRFDGGGYGPRQAFRGQYIDYAAYDEAMEKAFAVEDPRTIAPVSAYRIAYPVALSPACRDMYCSYLRSHDDVLCRSLIDREDIHTLKAILKEKLISPTALKASIEYARAAGKLRLIMGIIS